MRLSTFLSPVLFFVACSTSDPITPAPDSPGGQGGVPSSAGAAGSPSSAQGGQITAGTSQTSSGTAGSGEAGQPGAAGSAPNPSEGGSAGEGPAGGEAGAGGSEAGAGGSAQAGSPSTGGAAGQAGASQAGAAGASSECPSGAPGPKMVRIEGPDGKSFCIDTTEVSQGHYRAFLDVKKDDPGPQPEMCKANKTLEPPEPPSPELNEAGGCWPKGWSQTYTTSPEKPMTCVDWCDARAYCEWAGKRLCGKIGGGSLTEQELKNAKESEWSYACSQGNKSDYPYGDKYQAKVCNISNKKPANNTFSFENVGTSGCHGDGKPYDQLLDMIGNTYEWQDGAFQAPDSEGSDWIVWYYPLRGGSSYIADKTPEEVTCSWSAAMFNLDNVADIGFRCCAD